MVNNYITKETLIRFLTGNNDDFRLYDLRERKKFEGKTLKKSERCITPCQVAKHYFRCNINIGEEAELELKKYMPTLFKSLMDRYEPGLTIILIVARKSQRGDQMENALRSLHTITPYYDNKHQLDIRIFEWDDQVYFNPSLTQRGTDQESADKLYDSTFKDQIMYIREKINQQQ